MFVLRELAPTALLAKLALTELTLAELMLATLSVDSDDSTLSTELVAVKAPVVIVGTVPAKLMVGVLDRP